VKRKPTLKTEALVRLCREVVLDKKAQDVVVLDLRKISSVADYFLICSGTSEPQLKAIAEAVTLRLREEGVRPVGRDGVPVSRWVVMDYGDILIHIFHPEVRKRFALEQLWGDAKRLE
jgi:ribosome-associated protein